MACLLPVILRDICQELTTSGGGDARLFLDFIPVGHG
jgi:hypothetical protein